MKKETLSAKIQIAIFMTIFFVLMFLIAALNYWANPYEVFSHHTELYIVYDKSCERRVVYPKMKLRAYKDYDYVVAGPSTVEVCIFEENLERLFPDKVIYRLPLDGVTLSEQFDVIKNFINANPEVKKIYLFVDFDEMRNSNPNMLPKYGNNKLNKEDFCFLLLSSQTLKFSLSSIFLTAKEKFFESMRYFCETHEFLSKFKLFGNRNEEFFLKGDRCPELRYTNWGDDKIPNSSYTSLKEIKELCGQNNKELIFSVSPLHGNAIYDIFYQGAYEELEKFKKELVKISPFYDFLYVCKYTDKPISYDVPYFSDPMHAAEYLGDIMLKKMILGEGDYGVYITKNNIEEVLQENKKALQKYAKENKDALKEYVSYEGIN